MNNIKNEYLIEHLKGYYVDKLDRNIGIFKLIHKLKKKLGISPLAMKNIKKDILNLKDKNIKIKNKNKINLGLISTWNQHCGIAHLPSKFLVKEFLKNKINLIVLSEKTDDIIEKDEDFVYRCWERNDFNYKKILSIIKRNKINVVHIEFTAFIFKNKNNFLRLLIELHKRKIKVILSLHVLRSYLDEHVCKLADYIIVHNPALKRFIPHHKKYGNKIIYLNLGIPKIKNSFINNKFNKIMKSKKVISTFGFVAPYKNFPLIIKAINLIKKKIPSILLLFLISNHPKFSKIFTEKEYNKMLNLIEKYKLNNNVYINKGYLDDNELFSLLKKSDILLSYSNTSYLTQSGSAKLLISTLKPVIVNDTLFFGDMDKGVIKAKPNDHKDLAKKIINIIKDKNLQNRLKKESLQYIKENNMGVIANKYLDLYLK